MEGPWPFRATWNTTNLVAQMASKLFVATLQGSCQNQSLWISTGRVEPLFSTETHPSSSLMFT